MLLDNVLRDRNISKLQLALNAKIAPSDLYCAMNGKKPLYPAWKRKIAEYLQIDEDILFPDSDNRGD